EAVTGDVQHVVDAAHDPHTAVLVAMRAVAGDVVAIVETLPVSVDVTLVVAPDRAQHGRPRLRDDEQAALVGLRHALALFAHNVHGDAGKRPRARAGLRGDDAGNRRDQDRARLRLPPRVHDRAALVTDDAVIPHPRFRIDRLADRAEQAQLAQVVLVRKIVA